MAAKKGKRSALDDFEKPFKFIKFQSVGIQSSQKLDQVKTEDNFSEEDTKANISMNNLSNVEANASTLPSMSLANDPSTMEVTSNLESFPSNVKEEPFFSEEFGCTIKNACSLLLIARSPSFQLIKDIALTLPKLQKKKKRKFDEEIQNAAIHLNAGNRICFKILRHPSMKRCICELYIDDTLISIGRDNNEYRARKLAGSNACEILGKLGYLPIKTLNDLKSTTDEEELMFIKRFAEEVTKDTQSESAASAKIASACTTLNCFSHVNFFVVREDMRSPLHCRIYVCDFVIKKVLISYGKSTNKKCAKENAAEMGILFLAKYFNIHIENKSKDSTSTAPLKCEDAISTSKPSKSRNERKEKGINSQQLMEDIYNPKQSSIDISDTLTKEKDRCLINLDPVIMNYRLLDNSFQQQFAILDNSAIAPISQQTPQTILNYSMQFCKKVISFEVSETENHYPDLKPECHYRCGVILDGECIGLGIGASKSEAKCNASIKALQNLQNQFYTIKIKNEAEDGFFIHRSQVINAEAPTNAVSDSNIGCKMLKMMGWTGGSLGNSGGITEPIVASEHRFHQGLGFSKGDQDFNKFRSKIDTLLREFSHTETTSDLIFGLDFTKDERKQIHKIAERFGLVSSSRGKGQNRQLFVRHKLNINQILNQIVKAGGRTSKYEFVDKSASYIWYINASASPEMSDELKEMPCSCVL